MKIKQALTLLATLFLATNASLSMATSPETLKNYGIKGAKLVQRPATYKTSSYKVRGVTYTTLTTAKAKEYSKTGAASFYHNKFHGRRTASGEAFNQQGFTAAHKTLPLNSYVLVSNPRNNRKVIVRINDRGPFVTSREIDLSKAAAKELGMVAAGVKKVKMEVLHVERNGEISGAGAASLAKLAKNRQVKENIQIAKKTTDKPNNALTSIKMANISSKQEAEHIIEQLAMKNVNAEINKNGKKYEVLFTKLNGQQDVNHVKSKLNQMGKSQQVRLYTYNQ
ncbi:rare lipoprotein A [Cricetibacter osteomyelitidis]|uniref:Endolytic peptidoglycan transglycosylase RlpA n=1 Tax=Cricetibacter osteomyelitidis TaxID=1521931 RepID=A0A4R2SSM8_9PAST|nr:septal ring lytic transglycosylase RlpA family protein [Cricetibacter osteomyelitidis]TCP92185.1 rare lipoprotein A [Cricetibacter osteomyelitidis]